MTDDTKILAGGERIYIRKLLASDKSQKYLNWLNDPEVQQYSRRRGRTITMKDIEDFLGYAQFSHDLHCAIILKTSHEHIGNIAINSIDDINGSAEVSYMLGNRSYWHQHYEAEAIQLAAQVAFETLKLHRLWAELTGPNFEAVMSELHWVKEGIAREAFKLNGEYLDYTRWGILDYEWKKFH